MASAGPTGAALTRTGVATAALFAMALLLAGCAGREARLAGDRAWAAGDAVAAARHYEMAVSQQPKLAENERFAERLREARREGSYREGVALIQRRDWD